MTDTVFENEKYVVEEREFEERFEISDGQFANYHIVNKENSMIEVLCSTMNQAKATCYQMLKDEQKIDQYIEEADQQDEEDEILTSDRPNVHTLN